MPLTLVPLPDSIPVKYTEEEAEYLSVRPLVRQTFSPTELVDMVVSVAGKDLARVQKILSAGTVVFQSFRYWWTGFEADPVALRELLQKYPDAEPSRAFRAEDCAEVILESSGSPARHSLRIHREEAGKRRLLRSRSFWDNLMNLARNVAPAYREYSYSQRGDIYLLVLTPEQIARLAGEVARSAPRTLRADLAVLSSISQIVFVCPRPSSQSTKTI